MYAVELTELDNPVTPKDLPNVIRPNGSNREVKFGQN